MPTTVIKRSSDNEWYVIAARGKAPTIVQGRRAAWDEFRTRVGILPVEIQGVARDHLEDPAPTPPGFVAQGLAGNNEIVSLYTAEKVIVV